MKIRIQTSFEKDVLKITDKKLAIQVTEILETLENTDSLVDIHHLKKIKGKGAYYRIRIGHYRLGFKLEKNTVILLRFMNRKEIYKYFP